MTAIQRALWSLALQLDGRRQRGHRARDCPSCSLSYRGRRRRI